MLNHFTRTVPHLVLGSSSSVQLAGNSFFSSSFLSLWKYVIFCKEMYLLQNQKVLPCKEERSLALLNIITNLWPGRKAFLKSYIFSLIHLMLFGSICPFIFGSICPLLFGWICPFMLSDCQYSEHLANCKEFLRSSSTLE